VLSELTKRRAPRVELLELHFGKGSTLAVLLLIHGRKTVLLEVVANGRWVSPDPLADLFEGQSFGQVVL
jgi:hypothetical protein